MSSVRKKGGHPIDTDSQIVSELLEWNQLPDWQKDNEYILTGYRRASYSYFTSLRSLFAAHNETINIWSHLIGAGIFLYLMIGFWLYTQADVFLIEWRDKAVVTVYYLSVILCFILSTIFHIFTNHSPAMHTFGNQLDHLGIVVVIWGSTIPSIYFGFYERMFFILGYWIMSTTAAIACAVMTLQTKFRTRAYRTNRVVTYFLLGASAFVPFIHSIYMYGWVEQNLRMSISNFFGLAILNGSGAIIYGLRIPERWLPVRFDILGSSHQIMHVLVICGALVHLRGVLSALDFSQQQRNLLLQTWK